MLDRSRTFLTMASLFTDTSSVLEVARTWYSQHESLNIYSEECVKYARLLRQEQEKTIEDVSSCEIRIDDVKIGRISHTPFRKAFPPCHHLLVPDSRKGPPSTFFKIYIDGELVRQSETEVKTSTPVWAFQSYDKL